MKILVSEKSVIDIFLLYHGINENTKFGNAQTGTR